MLFLNFLLTVKEQKQSRNQCTFYLVEVLERWKKSMQCFFFFYSLHFRKVIHQFFQKTKSFTLCNKLFITCIKVELRVSLELLNQIVDLQESWMAYTPSRPFKCTWEGMDPEVRVCTILETHVGLFVAAVCEQYH